jgi:hypothetical protein
MVGYSRAVFRAERILAVLFGEFRYFLPQTLDAFCDELPHNITFTECKAWRGARLSNTDLRYVVDTVTGIICRHRALVHQVAKHSRPVLNVRRSGANRKMVQVPVRNKPLDL